MKKLILSLSLVLGICSVNLIAAEGQCPKSKGECPKQENCEKAKKDGGCCKGKNAGGEKKPAGKGA